MTTKILNYNSDKINEILKKANELQPASLDDYYTKNEIDDKLLDIDSFEGHTHSNKTVLDGITQSDIDKWNSNTNNGVSGESGDIIEVINARTTAKGEAHDGLANKTYASLSARLDFMDSRRVDKTRISKNVKDYGARGSWSSVPASTYYSTLEALKVDFPLAQSLNDEMDTLAIEKLVNEVKGSVYIPAGGYMINRQIKIAQKVCLFGAGCTVTTLQYCGSETTNTSMFKIDGNDVTIRDLQLYHNFTIEKIGADTITINALDSSNHEHCTYTDLFIIGFNTGIHFGENAWVHYLDRIRIQSCNTGVYGNSEFNNITFNGCNITYCDTAILAGAGRNIVIHGCDIERNSKGIIKRNVGDVIIRDNYFEFNTDGNIIIQWWDDCVDMAVIEGNSFFTSTDKNEKMIQYHTMADRPIIIRNNNFQGYRLASTCNILIPTNGTTVKPIFINNRWQKATTTYAGFSIGVTADKINADDYYKNGNHILYSSSLDLSSVLTEMNSSVRVGFSAGGIITLPNFSTMYDNSKCMKLVALATGSTNSTDKMTFNETNHSILGVKSIEPNQVYSIYYNRIADGKNEVIVFKG